MIDILMTVYNGEQYVVPQIESILNQTDSNWKLFIQDDCSTDRTVELIEPYVRRYPERITLLRNEKNSGSAQKNFFSMLPLVEHSYCMFCDHDDVWKPRKVEMTVRRMMELEQANGQDTPLLVHTDLAVADENLKVLSDSMFRSQNLNRKGNRLNNLLVQNNVTGCTMMVNKALVDMVGPAPKHAVMHDWWMALIAACFGKIGFVRQATILYRQHRANANTQQVARERGIGLKLRSRPDDDGAVGNERHSSHEHADMHLLAKRAARGRKLLVDAVQAAARAGLG